MSPDGRNQTAGKKNQTAGKKNQTAGKKNQTAGKKNQTSGKKKPSMSRKDRGDLSQVGASPRANEFLKSLVAMGAISELRDGYRLAVAVAIASRKRPRSAEIKGRKTMYATGALDPDGWMKTVVQECFPDWRETPYRAVEDLAEQGVRILESEGVEGDAFYFTPLLNKYAPAT